jgi:hypothetical protein
MEFITEDGYQVKPGMDEEYQQWVIDHAAEFRASLPEGIEYIGTYVTVFSSDQASGGWRDLFRIDSYGALDRWAAAAKDPDSVFGRLARESSRFVDLDRSPERWTHNLYKSAVDATVIDVPKEARELVGAGR